MFTTGHGNKGRVVQMMMTIVAAGLFGCGAAEGASNQDVELAPDSSDSFNKADNSTLSFKEKEPNNDFGDANLLDKALEFGKMTKISGHLNKWDQDRFKLPGTEDTIVYAYAVVGNAYDVRLSYVTGDENRKYFYPVVVNGVNYFEYKTNSDSLYVTVENGDKEADYVLWIGKIQVTSQNPAHAVIQEVDNDNNEIPDSINIVPGIWTDIQATIEYKYNDRDLMQFPMSKDWVLYGSVQNEPASQYRKFDVEIRAAKSGTLLGTLGAYDDVTGFRIVSDEDVMFTVFAAPGTEVDPNDPGNYTIRLTRVQRGARFEFPTTW